MRGVPEQPGNLRRPATWRDCAESCRSGRRDLNAAIFFAAEMGEARRLFSVRRIGAMRPYRALPVLGAMKRALRPPQVAELAQLAAEDVLPYSDALHRWATRNTSNSHEAEDLVQETLLHAIAHIGEVRNAERLSAWLFRIAERRLVDMIRRHRGTEVQLLTEPPAPSAEAALLEQSRHADLQRAVGRLPPSLRLPVRLYYLQERPLEEVARTLGTTLSAVKSRLYRARDQLRKRAQW